MAGSRVAALRALLSGGSGPAAVVHTGIATVLVLGINVVTGIVSARFLGAQGRGELSALLLCPQFLSFLFTLGLPASTIVKVRADPANAAGLMGAALLLSALAGLLAAVVGVLILPMLMSQYSAAAISAARGVVLLVVLGVTSTVLMAALQIRERFRAYNRLRFWQSFMILLSLAVLVAVHSFTPVSGAWAYVLPTLPFFAWNLWWVMREFRPRLADLGANSGMLLSYGWRVHVMDIGNTLFGQIDKLILVTLLVPAVFGVYVVVFNLSRLVTTFANSAIPVLLPRTAGKPAVEVVALTSRAFTATTVLTVGAVVGFVALGGIVLRTVYGPQFAAGYPVLVLLTLEAALAGGASVLQQPYIVLHRPGTVAIFHVLSLTLAGALVYLLGRRFGAEGAAAGLLAATCVRCLLTYRGFAWLLGVAAPRLWPTWTEFAGILERTRAGVT